MRLLLIGYLTVFFLSAAVRFGLDHLNIRHLARHGHEVPEVFAGRLENATLTRMRDYTLARTRVGALQDLANDALVLLILFSGIIPWLARTILAWDLPFVLAGLGFFGAISVIMGLLGIPFDLYDTFVIERRFGFSTTSWRLWLGDLLKATLVSAVLGGLMLSAFLALIAAAPATWWFWMWCFYAAFQVLIIILYPLVIAPLFNTFVPIEDPAIISGIEALMHKAGLSVKGVFSIDAAKRSRHSNAYFTGLGRTKRIVLYDTLLSSHTPDEILAVLAHEVGHWKKGHVLLQIIVSLLVTYGLLYGAYRLLHWPPLYTTFGIHMSTPYVGLLLLGLVVKPCAFFLTPVRSLISRAFERQADAYGTALTGDSRPLAQALKRLAQDNLSNLHPHPLYAWFYFTHPPVVERITRLQRM